MSKLSFCFLWICSVNPSVNALGPADFKVNNKDWLICSSWSVRPCILCYSFSFSNDITQMINFFARITGCNFFGFVSSDPTVCSTVDFPPLENSDHVTVSVSIYFLSTSKGDTLHCLAFDCHRADWDDLYDHLRHALWDWVVPGWNWCISLIVNIRSSLTHLHGFQLLVLLA